MKPIAVHLHLHYVSMWPKIKRYLRNLGQHPYHLYVTLTEDNPAVVSEIKKFQPNATVWQTMLTCLLSPVSFRTRGSTKALFIFPRLARSWGKLVLEEENHTLYVCVGHKDL